MRTRLEPAAGVAVGQPATLVVDVFTDQFFTSGIELPALNVPGAVIRLSDDRPPHISDTIRGANWVGIEHKYTITPIVAADLALPAFEISARIGPQRQSLTATTKPLDLHVVAPPGAEGAFVTHDLALQQTTDADLSALKVGDAFMRTIAATARGTPAMFIPDVVLGNTAGLMAYPQAPVLADSAPGTPVVGHRTFAVNYVVQQPGDFVLPAIDVRWWDLDTHKTVDARIPAVRIHAIAAPAAPLAFALPTEQPVAAAPRKTSWRKGLRYTGVGSAVVIGLWWLAQRWRRWFRDTAYAFAPTSSAATPFRVSCIQAVAVCAAARKLRCRPRAVPMAG
ncbi:hypothetical protein [Povalibacter sp.]|uniref:hypothetical protein n=1 Tax=Povalibacter sp. TaxID=1962978 RepID=UPI002F412AC6